MIKIKYILTIATICVISNTVFAAPKTYSGESLDNRIERMEKDLRILNKEVYKNGVSPLSSNVQTGMTKAQIADFEIRVSTLEESVRKMKGEVETMTYNQEQLATTVEKLQEDIDFRFNELQTKEVKFEEVRKPKVDLSAFKKIDAKIKPVSAVENKALASARGDAMNIAPERQYKAAFELLKEKDFGAAEIAFNKFIKDNPNHKLAGNAQYWLAETHYVRGDMKEAMKQFAYGYKNYKDSPKATDNLLKLGITLGAIERTDDACLTLKELETNYAPLSSTIETRMKNEQTKHNCAE